MGTKSLTLRKAFPSEFPNSESGASKDLISEETRALVAQSFLQSNEPVSFNANFRYNLYAFDEEIRDAIVQETINDTVAIKSAQRVVTDQGELYGTLYAPATATSTDSLSKVTGRSPITGFFALAGITFASAAAAEAAASAALAEAAEEAPVVEQAEAEQQQQQSVE